MKAKSYKCGPPVYRQLYQIIFVDEVCVVSLKKKKKKCDGSKKLAT
jgi:hypothetical protein